MTRNGQFKPGNSGRPLGSRNKLQASFIEALAKDFEENGQGVLNIVRLERPADYLKIIASVLPKEFVVGDNTLANLSEDELREYLAQIRAAKQPQEAAH